MSERLNDSSGSYLRATRKLGDWQTRFQRLEIYDTPHYGRILRADGCNLLSEREEFVYHENLIHPALTAQAAPRRVLIVGGGAGGAAEEALKHPSLEQVTLCEIDAELLQLAREHFTSVHRGVFDNPKLRLRVGDGLKLLRETHERFDLIALDPGDPAAPAEDSHALELLQRCRQALAPGGALVLPIGMPVARPERVAELAQRLNGVFRIVRPYTLYVPLRGGQCALAVCSDKLDPKSFTADEIDRRIEQRRLQDLRFYNGETHEGVFALPNYVRDLVNPPRLRLQLRSRRLGVVS
ncbi:MAG: polyamine aminopropyltransferase [Betaproteobacteria bacterium]|nr:MAG: polyamine aminopropyltransferase [Betaproteobacteria bacterium]